MTTAFSVGGMWEFAEWEIRENVEVDAENACPHCHSRRPEGVGYRVICPRVVVAWNESGFNSTGVCLDCIKAAIERGEV